MVIALSTLWLSPSISTSGWCSNISRCSPLSFVLLVMMVVVLIWVVVVVTSTVTIPWSLVVVVPIVNVMLVGVVGVVGEVFSSGFLLYAPLDP